MKVPANLREGKLNKKKQRQWEVIPLFLEIQRQ